MAPQNPTVPLRRVRCQVLPADCDVLLRPGQEATYEGRDYHTQGYLVFPRVPRFFERLYIVIGNRLRRIFDLRNLGLDTSHLYTRLCFCLDLAVLEYASAAMDDTLETIVPHIFLPLLPTYSLRRRLLLRRRSALCFCRPTCWITPTLLALLSSTRLTCLTINPALAVVLREPRLETIGFLTFSSSRHFTSFHPCHEYDYYQGRHKTCDNRPPLQLYVVFLASLFLCAAIFLICVPLSCSLFARSFTICRHVPRMKSGYAISSNISSIFFAASFASMTL